MGKLSLTSTHVPLIENFTQIMTHYVLHFLWASFETSESKLQQYFRFAVVIQIHIWSRALIKCLSTWSTLKSRYRAFQFGCLEISVLCLFSDREFHLLTSKWSYENQITDAVRHTIPVNIRELSQRNYKICPQRMIWIL